MDNMSIAITVLTSILGSIISAIITVHIKNRNDRQSAVAATQKQLFQTLWITRANNVSADHVTAVNMIRIVFYGVANITTYWKTYFDHLHQESEKYPGGHDSWELERQRRINELLARIATHLKYDIDEVEMKKVYTPHAQYLNQLDQITIQKNLVKILMGQQPLPIEIRQVTDPSPAMTLPNIASPTTGANSAILTTTTSSNNSNS